MNDLRVRGAQPQIFWGEPFHDYRADSPSSPPRFNERPPRRSGDSGANLGRRYPQRPPERDDGPLNRPPRRRDSGFGVNGPPRGPSGSNPQWFEPDDDEWSERPARPARRPSRDQWEPDPRPTRRPRPSQKKPKRPLTPEEKRRRWFRYLALLGVMGFASLGGASLSFSLVAVGVISLVCCLPCAALFLYL
ncbi:MAG TPA: hypothetical protein VH540_22910 [Ktedonobacterales bacterium]